MGQSHLINRCKFHERIKGFFEKQIRKVFCAKYFKSRSISILHWCAKIKWRGGRRRGGGRGSGGGRRGRGRSGKDFGSAAARKKKIKICTKTWKTKKLCKTLKKSIKTSTLEELRINGRHHQILRENYPYRLVFKSVRLKMAGNMLLHVCKRCIRS